MGDEICDTPVNTLCMDAGSEKCYDQCVASNASNAGKQLCLPSLTASCLGKDEGSTCQRCTASDRDQSCGEDEKVESLCGPVAVPDRDQSCGDSNCYGCLEPKIAACMGKA